MGMHYCLSDSSANENAVDSLTAKCKYSILAIASKLMFSSRAVSIVMPILSKLLPRVGDECV